MDERDYWMLLGLIVLVSLRVSVLSRHVKLHDEMLFALHDRDRAVSEALGG